jgi:hypothetical protein
LWLYVDAEMIVLFGEVAEDIAAIWQIRGAKAQQDS